MNTKYAQLDPEEEAIQPQQPQQPSKWDRLKNKARDKWDFTKSVWHNPTQQDVDWHQQNIQRMRLQQPEQQDVAWHQQNIQQILQGLRRKPTWLQLSLMTPQIRQLYNNLK